MSGRWRDRTWLWPAIGSLLLLVFVFALSEELKFGIITANLAAASFPCPGRHRPDVPDCHRGRRHRPIDPVRHEFLRIPGGQDDFRRSLPRLFWSFAAIAFGTLIGLVNGAVVVQFRVSADHRDAGCRFVVFYSWFRSSRSAARRRSPTAPSQTSSGSFLGIPTPAFVVLLIGCAVSILVNRRLTAGRCWPSGRTAARPSSRGLPSTGRSFSPMSSAECSPD